MAFVGISVDRHVIRILEAWDGLRRPQHNGFMRNPINARGMILATLATLAASASADLVANFDTFTEGQVFDSFSDGYIFFSNVYASGSVH